MGALDVRRGTLDDLGAALEVWYATELQDDPRLPPLTVTPDALRHDVERGDLFVAEREGAIVGFASSFARGRVRFLSNLFVEPRAQNAGVGRALLERTMPRDGLVNCTMSSRDPRAVALYVRHGMPPRWPHLLLEAHRDSIREGGAGSDVTIHPAGRIDEELVRWDAEASGRPRRRDLEHLVTDMDATAFWLERGGTRVGYAFVQGRSPFSLARMDQAVIGPVGVRDAADAAPCVRAALRVAVEERPVVAVSVPGPHPALPALVEAGFRIRYVELFMSEQSVVDPTRYLASGSEMF